MKLIAVQFKVPVANHPALTPFLIMIEDVADWENCIAVSHDVSPEQVHSILIGETTGDNNAFRIPMKVLVDMYRDAVM